MTTIRDQFASVTRIALHLMQDAKDAGVQIHCANVLSELSLAASRFQAAGLMDCEEPDVATAPETPAPVFATKRDKDQGQAATQSYDPFIGPVGDQSSIIGTLSQLLEWGVARPGDTLELVAMGRNASHIAARPGFIFRMTMSGSMVLESLPNWVSDPNSICRSYDKTYDALWKVNVKC